MELMIVIILEVLRIAAGQTINSQCLFTIFILVLYHNIQDRLPYTIHMVKRIPKKKLKDHIFYCLEH